MRKIVAFSLAAVLVALGAVALVVSASLGSTADFAQESNDQARAGLAAEKIVFSADPDPAEVEELPCLSEFAGQLMQTGEMALCQANLVGMHVDHRLVSTQLTSPKVQKVNKTVLQAANKALEAEGFDELVTEVNPETLAGHTYATLGGISRNEALLTLAETDEAVAADVATASAMRDFVNSGATLEGILYVGYIGEELTARATPALSMAMTTLNVIGAAAIVVALAVGAYGTRSSNE